MPRTDSQVVMSTEKRRERNRECMQKWRATNPEKVRVYTRNQVQKWRAANPEKQREYNRNYYALAKKQRKKQHELWKSTFGKGLP